MKEKQGKEESQKAEIRTPEAPRRKSGFQMKRREFVQAGLAGAAATLGVKGAPLEELAAPQEAASAGPCPPTEPLPCNEVPGAGTASPETWNTAWVWRPGNWPGQQLDLNVVENQNPGPPVTLGNPNAILFSYGNNTPGPTIRMKGDETLYVKLRNLLGQDFGSTAVGPNPDPRALTPGLDAEVCKLVHGGQVCDKETLKTFSASENLPEVHEVTKADVREDFCLGEHTNGVHSVRVTNLHTHGLHVRPSLNPDGTQSDNVILRVLSQGDFNRREQEGSEASCRFLEKPEEIYFLRDDEQTGEADFEFRLGNVQRKKRERENNQRAKLGKPPLPPQPHPAGTFWYHPHAHGATTMQVASGMAGYLIVEGDVDEAVNRALTQDEKHPQGIIDPDPEIMTGPYDYRERLMFMQRVLFRNRSQDKDAPNQSLRVGATPLVNGNNIPATIRMSPGAVERWRVINGSVDGRGFKRFMVVKGQYAVRNRMLFEVIKLKAKEEVNPNTLRKTTVCVGEIDPEKPFTLADLERLEGTKQNLYQLSIDGITLLTGSTDNAQYTIKDLSKQGVDPRTGQPYPNPLWKLDPECAKVLQAELKSDSKAVREAAATLCRLRNVWKDGNSIRNTWVRNNEYYMGPANRTDVFFQAPREITQTDPCTGEKFEVFTVLARTVLVHSDTPQQSKQIVLKPNDRKVPPVPSPEDVVVAYIVVSGDPVEGKGNPVIEKALPRLKKVKVQDYLLPIEDKELQIPAKEAKARGATAGDSRTRIVTYSGWGSADYPLVSTYPNSENNSSQSFRDFIARDDGKLKNKVYAENGNGPDGPYYVLLPPNLRSMATRFNNANIEQERSRAEHPDDRQFRFPTLPRKFDPTEPYRTRVLEDTAEEWALYNVTDMLWGNTTTVRKAAADPVDSYNDPTSKDFKQPPTQFKQQYVAYAVSRAEGQEYFFQNRDFQIVTRGIDHPFHIHQNPFWMTRLEIPDENGKLHNILLKEELDAGGKVVQVPDPRWGDTIWIPRRRGRVVFRSRYPDYVGTYVHHCHILLHEDNGMMTVVEATPFDKEANYKAQKSVASAQMTSEEVSNIYPRPTREEGYTNSSRFFDPDPSTGQIFPGFVVSAPSLDE